MDRTSPGNDLVTIATLLSRVEALCVASMLEAQGIAVHIGAYHHASTEVIPLALGGYRLWIAEADYQAASDLIREVGTAEHWEFSYAVRRAVLRLLAFWVGVFVVLGAASAAVLLVRADLARPGPVPWYGPILILIALPVNPQGSGDFYLAPAKD